MAIASSLAHWRCTHKDSPGCTPSCACMPASAGKANDGLAVIISLNCTLDAGQHHLRPSISCARCTPAAWAQLCPGPRRARCAAGSVAAGRVADLPATARLAAGGWLTPGHTAPAGTLSAIMHSMTLQPRSCRCMSQASLGLKRRAVYSPLRLQGTVSSKHLI